MVLGNYFSGPGKFKISTLKRTTHVYATDFPIKAAERTERQTGKNNQHVEVSNNETDPGSGRRTPFRSGRADKHRSTFRYMQKDRLRVRLRRDDEFLLKWDATTNSYTLTTPHSERDILRLKHREVLRHERYIQAQSDT